MKQERDYEYDAPIKPFAFRSIDLSPASQGFLCEPDRYRHLETSKFKKVIHTFSWYDLKNNFLGYWVISDNLKNIEEIKFDKEGKIFSVSRTCSEFNNNNIGELIWE